MTAVNNNDSSSSFNNNNKCSFIWTQILDKTIFNLFSPISKSYDWIDYITLISKMNGVSFNVQIYRVETNIQVDLLMK
jgi:hypothetical protein